MSDLDQLIPIVRAGMEHYYREDLPEDGFNEEETISDAILSSDWLARVKREAKAAAWWEGVNDQWKHRPIGNRVLETDNPHRKQVD